MVFVLWFCFVILISSLSEGCCLVAFCSLSGLFAFLVFLGGYMAFLGRLWSIEGLLCMRLTWNKILLVSWYYGFMDMFGISLSQGWVPLTKGFLHCLEIQIGDSPLSDGMSLRVWCFLDIYRKRISYWELVSLNQLQGVNHYQEQKENIGQIMSDWMRRTGGSMLLVQQYTLPKVQQDYHGACYCSYEESLRRVEGGYRVLIHHSACYNGYYIYKKVLPCVKSMTKKHPEKELNSTRLKRCEIRWLADFKGVEMTSLCISWNTYDMIIMGSPQTLLYCSQGHLKISLI